MPAEPPTIAPALPTVLSNEFEKISAYEATEWLLMGRPHPDERAVILDDDGNPIGVLLSVNEYRAIAGYVKLTTDPERMQINASRIRSIRNKGGATFEEFFELQP